MFLSNACEWRFLDNFFLHYFGLTMARLCSMSVFQKSLSMNNITDTINAKRLLKLHNNSKHPVGQLKHLVQDYFSDFSCFDDLSEVVSIKQNFDDLLMPADHPARSANDTYYLDNTTVLRTHTSAHQHELLERGETKFLVTGDVYRKDTIDKTHYPVFHQMEAVKVLPNSANAFNDLIITLEGLVNHLFPKKEYRFLDDYFPFTHPSLQIEIKQGDNWIEILGGGVIQPKILENCKVAGTGWAFGLGIERLLINLCGIPDIRYFWTNDERFIRQFQNGLTAFRAYSKYPVVKRDISFWVTNYAVNSEGIWEQHNNFSELCRDIGKDLIESITLMDNYWQDNKVSLTYRIVYRSNDRTFLNEEINEIQNALRMNAEQKFNLLLR